MSVRNPDDPSLDASGFLGELLVSPVVPVGFAYRRVNKDAFNWIDNFLIQGGSALPTYFNLWGAYGTSNTPGNLHAVWTSITHKGAGEVGLFIGDWTTTADGLGGNGWGIDVVGNDFAGAQMYGGRIALNPQVARGVKPAIAWQLINLNDAIQLDQALTLAGNWNRHIIGFSDAAKTALIYDLDNAGNLRAGGNITPLASSTKSLGSVGFKWQNLFLSTQLNIGGAGAGGGSLNIAMVDAAVNPTTAPSPSGIVNYSSGGSWKVKQTTVPSVTGSRGANAALASLLTVLAATGLLADTTTV